MQEKQSHCSRESIQPGCYAASDLAIGSARGVCPIQDTWYLRVLLATLVRAFKSQSVPTGCESKQARDNDKAGQRSYTSIEMI
ncbi:unnamed protein product [Leptosia nina]|uniref:Uncharacterized protein n=1 Tax=Leptosia nina TaxID=320188 RepID=A0AAV1JUU1_9NEOP